MNVLACDLGGTHTRVALAQCEQDRCTVLREQFYDSSAYAHALPIFRDFLAHDTEHTVTAACIAVAGAIEVTAGGQLARVTNLPWQIDSLRLCRELGLERVSLINDFEAIAYGIGTLGEGELVSLQDGRPVADAPRAILGAGTGLGQAIVLTDDCGQLRTVATEGGHADFAPVDELQDALLRYVRKESSHVSYEHLLSGHGLVRILNFLVEYRQHAPSAALTQAMTQEDAAAAISRHALAGDDTLASEALDVFVAVYGAQAGNLALATLARGGVYLAGGIAPKILPRLQQGLFMQRFRAKGKMAAVMDRFPIHVITNTHVGLMGAAYYAAHH